MDTDNKKAVVVGGSISGLMAAVALRSAGYTVTVLERTPADEFRGRGSGLGIRPEVVTFFEQFEVDRSLQRLGTFNGTSVCKVLALDGSVAGEIKFPARTKSSSWDGVVAALRSLFDDYCSDAGTGEYHFGARVTGIEEEDGSSGGGGKKKQLVVVYEDDERTERRLRGIDLVIGADGASSIVRKLMLGDVQREYAGYVFQRGRVRASAVSQAVLDLHDDATVVQTDPGCSNISYFLSSGSDGAPADLMLGYYSRYTADELKTQLLGTDGQQYTSTLPASQMRPEAFELMKQRAEGRLCPQMRELLDALAREDVVVQVIGDMIAAENCSMDGRVLLVGEAGAVLRPHAFAGTAQAAFHALRLADLASGKITVREWSEDCLGYSKILQEGSAELGEKLMGEHALRGLECWQKQFAIMGKLMGRCAPLKAKLGQSSTGGAAAQGS